MSSISANHDWVILHLPHDSTVIPDGVRKQFVLDDMSLVDELLKMTDHFTGELFGGIFTSRQTVRAPVSRLVVDVERFDDDKLEPMSVRGMGAVYLSTQNAGVLRNPVSPEQRRELMESYYFPHHQALTAAVEGALAKHNRALVLDAHSFPRKPLPYEFDQSSHRPEICIGTDDFHTPAALREALVSAFRSSGFDVGVDAPFSGALVPQRYYRHDVRVSSVMVEVRRDIYMDEEAGTRNSRFSEVVGRLRRAITRGFSEWINNANFCQSG